MNFESVEEFGRAVYYGNALSAWIKAFLQFAVWLTVLPLARAFIARRLRKRTADHPIGPLLLLQALVDATTGLFMVAVATWLAMRWLAVPEWLDRIGHTLLLAIVWLQVALWATAAVRHLIDMRRGHELPGAEGAASLNILRFVGVLFVWIVAFLMLLTNLGVKVGPLVAGLGIGGIAIALAVQNLLGDLFASLSIALDKPFRVGDYLVIGEEKGTVEQVGIKSTRLRSVTGEQIVLSNGELLKSRLRNYGLLPERRAELNFRVVYETPRHLVAEIPSIVESVIRAQKNTRFERAHFARYGDWALLFEAVYFVQDSDLRVFMDAQQAINLRLLDEFARRGISFAYPTTRSMSISAPVAPDGAA